MERETETFDAEERLATLRAAAGLRDAGQGELADVMTRYVTNGLPDPATLTPWDAARDEHLASLGVPVEPPRVA